MLANCLHYTAWKNQRSWPTTYIKIFKFSSKINLTLHAIKHQASVYAIPFTPNAAVSVTFAMDENQRARSTQGQSNNQSVLTCLAIAETQHTHTIPQITL